MGRIRPGADLVAIDIGRSLNELAIETMKSAKHPIELFLHVVTVKRETIKMVNSLPSNYLIGSMSPVR
ncbi:MAG: hypothetical protein A2002_11700 [Pseudomonadales bacterium GWC1_66_9]|nr:MAG: hypothetical protein A2002_11700 [Pseudomonadales bacterium GWC1_66_9]